MIVEYLLFLYRVSINFFRKFEKFEKNACNWANIKGPPWNTHFLNFFFIFTYFSLKKFNYFRLLIILLKRNKKN